MASLIYNRFKANLMNKEVDLEGDTVKVALLDENHSASTTNDNVWSDVSANELASGSGYTTGGATLSGKSVTQGTASGGNLCKWDATDTEWTSASFTAYYAVIYDETATSNLILSIDFGAPAGLTVVNGTFKIVWNTVGILALS